MTKAIIFDFDGVLVSSEEPRFNAIQRSAARYHIIIEAKSFKNMVGRTTINFLTDVLADHEKPLINNIMSVYEKGYRNNIEKYVKPISLSVEFVRNDHDSMLLAVASMNSRNVVEKLLRYFGIDTKFKKIICKEDVVNHKPHPEIYLKTAKDLGLSVHECIVIEDSIIGAESALNAGMECYVLLNGINNKEEFKGVKINGFIRSKHDLEKVIKK